MYVQKGTQRIEIIVRKEGGGSLAGANQVESEKVSNASATSGSTFLSKITGTESVARQHRILKTNATHALAMTRQVVLQGFHYWVGGLGMQHGDQAVQDAVQREVEKGQDISGFASSVAMGALYGSWGGPLGTMLGASMAAITTAVSTGFKYKSRERDFNYKLFKENNSIQYKRARASINLTNGRLR